jgi:hypothetical protein
MDSEVKRKRNCNASTAGDDPKIDYSLFFRLSGSANPTTRVLNRRSMVARAYCLNIFIVTIIGPRDAASILDHRVTETAHWLAWQHWADPILQKPYDIKDGLIHTRRARHRLGME